MWKPISVMRLVLSVPQKNVIARLKRTPVTTNNALALNHKNYNFLDCDWFKKLLFSTNSLAKLLSDSLLLDSLLLDSLLSNSSVSQSHSKLYFKSTNHIQSCSLNQPISISE